MPGSGEYRSRGPLPFVLQVFADLWTPFVGLLDVLSATRGKRVERVWQIKLGEVQACMDGFAVSEPTMSGDGKLRFTFTEEETGQVSGAEVVYVGKEKLRFVQRGFGRDGEGLLLRHQPVRLIGEVSV